VVLAVAVTVCFHLPRNRLTDLAAGVASAACIVLPVVLMEGKLSDSAARVYCVVVAAASMALVVRLVSMPRIAAITMRDCWIAIGCFATVCGSVLIFLKAQGIGFLTLLYSLILVHLRMSVNSGSWYIGPPLGIIWIPWALAGLGAALFIGKVATRTRERGNMLFSVGAIFGLAVFARHSLLGFAPPFCWLGLTAPSEKQRTVQSFPRTLLCAVAILQSLYAYPIAGSQFPFIHVLFIVLVAVCAHDAIVAAPFRAHLTPRLVRGVAAAVLIGVAVAHLGVGYHWRQQYSSLPALGLRGAERIHVDAQQRRSYHWLATNIEKHCDVIFGLPDLLSLTFWTSREPLTTISGDAWILFYTEKQQMVVRNALSKHADACIVYNPELVGFWNRAGKVDVEGLPLVRHIRDSFKVSGNVDSYYLLVRKARDVKVSESVE